MSREIPFIKIRPLTSDTLVHLHWLYKKGPALLRGVTEAISLCGKKKLPRGRITAHVDDVTCPKCKGRITQ
jgi:hypothetical protein